MPRRWSGRYLELPGSQVAWSWPWSWVVLKPSCLALSPWQFCASPKWQFRIYDLNYDLWFMIYDIIILYAVWPMGLPYEDALWRLAMILTSEYLVIVNNRTTGPYHLCMTDCRPLQAPPSLLPSPISAIPSPIAHRPSPISHLYLPSPSTPVREPCHEWDRPFCHVASPLMASSSRGHLPRILPSRCYVPYPLQATAFSLQFPLATCHLLLATYQWFHRPRACMSIITSSWKDQRMKAFRHFPLLWILIRQPALPPLHFNNWPQTE